MATVYTKINKASGTAYTYVDGTDSKIKYDESSITYDSSTTFYDGSNQSLFTKIKRPTTGFVTTSGMTTGLLTPPTYLGKQTKGLWTKINKGT